MRMTTRTLGLWAVALVALAGCSTHTTPGRAAGVKIKTEGGSAQLGGGGDADRACALVSAQEVTTTLGYPVSEGSPSSIDIGANGKWSICSFANTDSSIQPVAVEIRLGKTTKEQFEAYVHEKEGSSHDAQPVSGIGDEAFALQGTDLHVLKGSTELLISVGLNADKVVEPFRKAPKLAELVINRL